MLGQEQFHACPWMLSQQGHAVACTLILQLVYFCIAQAFDAGELLLRGSGDCLNSVHMSFSQFFDICRCHSELLCNKPSLSLG